MEKQPRNIKCHNCEEVVNRSRSQLKSKHIFCSRKCYLEALKKDISISARYKGVNRNYQCLFCKESFTRRPHNTKHTPKYCSMTCSAKHRGQNQAGEKHWNWKGGNDTRYIRKTAPRVRPEFCEICGSKGGKRNGIVVDHNHKTGKFRGWLCSNCNTIIGLSDEDTKRLHKIIDYINENSL